MDLKERWKNGPKFKTSSVPCSAFPPKEGEINLIEFFQTKKIIMLNQQWQNFGPKITDQNSNSRVLLYSHEMKLDTAKNP